MISISINVLAIEKQRLFDGKKGTYLDCVLIPTPNSEYGDYMVVQSVSKEEREQGVKGPILGNGKDIVRRDPTNHNTPPDATIDNSNSGPDDLPF
jgi:hypothetical protein